MSGSDGAEGASIWEVFSVVPDHQQAEGKRYPLAGLLMIALAAMLAGRSDQLGIVRWGRKLSREALAELGILRGRVPAPSVWSELFRALDVGALERLLGAWVKGAGAAGHVDAASGCGAAPSAMCPECICWPRSANGCKVSSGNCGGRRRPTRSRRP